MTIPDALRVTFPHGTRIGCHWVRAAPIPEPQRVPRGRCARRFDFIILGRSLKMHGFDGTRVQACSLLDALEIS